RQDHRSAPARYRARTARRARANPAAARVARRAARWRVDRAGRAPARARRARAGTVSGRAWRLGRAAWRTAAPPRTPRVRRPQPRRTRGGRGATSTGNPDLVAQAALAGAQVATAALALRERAVAKAEIGGRHGLLGEHRRRRAAGSVEAIP